MTKFDHLKYEPWPQPSNLLRDLERSAQITHLVMSHLGQGLEMVPLSSNLNPPYWEFGHLVWFQEFWVHRQGLESNPSLLPNADALFNSSKVFHDDRWSIPLPTIDILMKYFLDVTGKSYDILRSGSLTPEQAYFMQLALFHQDMHNEAFAYMWQHLAYPWPVASESDEVAMQFNGVEPSYIDIPTRQIKLGSELYSGFIFDNEKWQHEVTVNHFAISSHAVNNGQYLEFLDGQHDANPVALVQPPLHWKKEGDHWHERFFDQWLAMNMQAPVRHISALDAERYCDWRGVRLPTENELTAVMLQLPINWHHSRLWEWTSSVFMPFPGFTPDPYQDYSAPWFDGNHRVLKGWSSYTPEYLRRPQFRNFYLPTRSDPFCGFRTCLA